MVRRVYNQGPHAPRQEGQSRKGLLCQEQLADKNKTQGVGRWIDGAGFKGKKGQSKPSHATKARVFKSFSLERAQSFAGQQTRNWRRIPEKKGGQHEQGDYMSSVNLKCSDSCGLRKVKKNENEQKMQ